MRASFRSLVFCLSLLPMSLSLGACNSGSSGGATPVTSVTGTSDPGSNHASSLLVWAGNGASSSDLECLLAAFSRQNLLVDLVSEVDLGSMTSATLAAHLGLIFPDGSSTAVLSVLPAQVQQLIKDSVNTFGLHLITVGGTAGIAGTLGLVPTKSSFWSTLLGIAELVLGDASLFFPQVAIISQFLDGLPAIVQLISGNGAVSLYAPQTTTPSCSTDLSSAPPGAIGSIDPLQTLIQLIQNRAPATGS